MIFASWNMFQLGNVKYDRFQVYLEEYANVQPII
jgi:hypothetical protein